MLNPLPVNPAKITLKFPTRTCGFDPSNLAPPVYSLSQSTTLPGVNIGSLEFTEDALALFTPATSTTTPTNNTALQSLIQQFSTDFLNWRQTQFDIVLAGIANVAQNGLIQVTEFDYNSDMCRTRITSLPDNFPPDRLAHQITTLSSDCPNTSDSNTAEPCGKFYGPPINNQISGSVVLDEFLLCFEDGRLTEKFLQQVTYNCGCGSTSTCHASVQVTGCNNLPLAGATVNVAGVGSTTTDANGNAIITISVTGTYSVTASFPGLISVTVSHEFTCPGIGGLTIALVNTGPGFGCCAGGFPLPLPLTLFATVCGTMITLNATTTGMPGNITINNWTGGATLVIPQAVAKFSTVPCVVGSWDGVSFTTGFVFLNITIVCSGSAAPPVLFAVAVSSTANETTNFNPGLCDPLANPDCCGGELLALNNIDGTCTGLSGVVTGTWGPTVAVSGSIGTFVTSEGFPNCVPSGLSCTAIEITS
jgi:hypothetical protein